MIWILFAIGFFIAFVNGANDVSKGIATLVGSGVTNYRRAILWGSLWTGMGGVLAFYFAGAMVQTFGHGLFSAEVQPTLSAAVATLLGAALWILFATKTGLPVSTTHAIVGSLAGVGAFAYGVHEIRWSAFVGKIVLPLLLSPVVAALTVAVIARSVKWLFGPAPSSDCLCADAQAVPIPSPAHSGSMPAMAVVQSLPIIRIFTGSTEDCSVASPTFGLSLNQLHWFTSGATSLARGMNDAPKMVALVLAASALLPNQVVLTLPAFLLVTFGMLLGSYLAGLRVTTVLAEKVTKMDHRGGFLTNLVTAVLVLSGAVWGLPMSTTHVSSSAIIRNGAQESISHVNWRVVYGMVLAWIVTLPVAALLGIMIYAGLK